MAKLDRLVVCGFLGTLVCSGGTLGCYTGTLSTSGDMALLVYQNRISVEAETSQRLAVDKEEFVLGIEQAIKLASEADATLKVRRAFLSRAKAGVSAVGQYRNPEVRYSQEKLEDFMGDETRMDVEFRVRPPRPGELGAREEIAKSKKRTAEARLRMAKEQVAYKIRGLFREIGFVDAEVEATRKSIQIRTRLVGLTKTRVKEGLATKMDLALVEVAFFEALQDDAELQTEREFLIKDLLRRIGLLDGTKIVLDNKSVMETTFISLPSEEELIRRALNSREELEVSASRIKEADARVYIEKLQAFPWFSLLKVGYEIEPGKKNNRAVTGGLALDIPLFSLNSGEIEAAEAEKSLRSAQFGETVGDIVRSVREQYRRVNAAAQAAQALEKGAKFAVSEGAAAAKSAMEAGQVDIRGFMLIEERRASVHRKWLRALRRYSQEFTKLMGAVGGDLHS